LLFLLVVLVVFVCLEREKASLLDRISRALVFLVSGFGRGDE
jgi:hypothetical protein